MSREVRDRGTGMRLTGRTRKLIWTSQTVDVTVCCYMQRDRHCHGTLCSNHISPDVTDDLTWQCNTVHNHLKHNQWQTSVPPQLFMALFLGPPAWADARRELLDFTVQGKIRQTSIIILIILHNEHWLSGWNDATKTCFGLLCRGQPFRVRIRPPWPLTNTVLTHSFNIISLDLSLKQFARGFVPTIC